MATFSDCNMPMWDIVGHQKLNKYATLIAQLNSAIKELEVELESIDKEIDIINNRLNFYLSNKFKIQNFDQSEFTMVIGENYQVNMYRNEDIGPKLESGEPLKVSDLPDPFVSMDSNKKQVSKIMKMLAEYNILIEEYNITLYTYEESVDEHKDLWDSVRELITNTEIFGYHDDKNSDVEIYNEEEHMLIVAKDVGSEHWSFKYIRKENEEEFNEFLKKLNS